MLDNSIDALVKQAVAANSVLARLLEAKAHSDKSRYELKNQILKELMDQAPEDWVVDDPKSKYKGVTHLPTKFKLHADPRVINPAIKIKGSIPELAKQAAETLQHYNPFNKFDLLRPPTYEELAAIRSQGRWKDNPQAVEKYVKGRKKLEAYLARKLIERGVDHPKDTSFLYASLAGKNKFVSPEDTGYMHESTLTPEIIDRSFFDVVGDGKSRTMLGVKGLNQALRRWEKAEASNKLSTQEYMGMPIRPRIEVITPMSIKPEKVYQLEKEKQAANYSVSGEKVQGVGLRKLYHSLLDEHNLPGIAVNNEETGDVELNFGGDEEQRKKVFDELAKRIREKTQHPVSYNLLAGESNLSPVSLKSTDIARINAINHLAYRMSKFYDPANSQMKTDSQTRDELAERFRLTPKGEELTGSVPPRALEQLLSKRPMYQAMLPSHLIRGMDEALQETPDDIRTRLSTALKTDKGFLAKSIPELAKQAATLDADLDTFKSQAKLMGSRGRAQHYGRPEPADRDYDYIAFTDDETKQQQLKTLLSGLANHGFKLKNRPGGFLTASGQNMDLSVYPTSKQNDIYRAWALIESGMSKDDAWAQVEKEKQAALKSDVQLQPHQQRIIDRMRAGDNRLLLYHGLGSGKSLSSLAAAESAGGPYTAVTPASLKQNYEKEIEKFTEDSDPEVMSYTGIGAGKTPSKAPQTVIFDEAHRLRNPNTAGARAARNLTSNAKNLLVLTGTPITNEPSDLASLLGLLRNENITPKQFDENFVGHRKVYPSLLSRLTGSGVGEEVFVKNEGELRNMLKGKVDYQPSKTPEGVNVKDEIVKVPLSAAQERIQNAIISKVPPEWAWKLNKEFPLTRDELKSLNSFLTGLRQSSLSTQPFRKDKNLLTSFQQSAKLQKAYADLQEELGSDPRKKAIVYSNYIGAGIDPYAAALEANKVPYGVFHGGIPLKQRKKTLQDYNEGKIRALLLGPAAAEGISTKGTNLIQLLDPHWHESRLNQARGRGLRFDSHTGLPEDLKNVAVKRYISESKDPSFLGWLMGYKRERTGDEILQTLAARKEKANDLFRQILKEEGAPKKAGDDSMEKTLQDLLANCIDLSLLFKHCHWNAKGTMFKPLHDFLDEVYERLIKTGDDIAERMVALDYPASGLISQISASSAMAALPLKFMPCPDIVNELTTRLTTLCEMFNKAIKSTESDPVTSNMLQDMTHTLEKSLWMLKRQKENSDEIKKTAASLVLNQMFR